MDFDQSKFFINIESNKLSHFPVPKNKEYYAFVKDKIKGDFSQIIISSDIMIKLLTFAFSKRKAKIVEIELLEDDPDYQSQLNTYISKANNNRDLFIDLVDELKYLSDERTAELRLLQVKYRVNEIPVVISITVNGLITYSLNEESKKEISTFEKIIAELLI